MISKVNDYNNNIGLVEVLRAFQQETISKLNVMKIGIIDEVLENNEVKCLITNKRLLRTNDDGTCVWQDYPPIFARVWYMGTATENMSYPITPQNPCLLLFNDREIDSYFSTGEVSPLCDFRMHSINDAICIPLYRPETNPKEMQINASVCNINAETINLTGNVVINGVPYTQHVHSNGNQGKNTGGVVE